MLGGKRILWWERQTAKGKPSDEWIWRRGAGMIESFQSTPYEKNGRAALASAESQRLLGTVTRLHGPPSSLPPALAQAKGGGAPPAVSPAEETGRREGIPKKDLEMI